MSSNELALLDRCGQRGRLCRKQGLMINSFYVLRESLANFKKFAEGLSSGVEKGNESVDKGSFKLPDMYGGSSAAAAAAAAGAPSKKGGAPPAKAAPAKGGKGKEEDKSDEHSAAEVEERKLR